jgi:hypothetical protein
LQTGSSTRNSPRPCRSLPCGERRAESAQQCTCFTGRPGSGVGAPARCPYNLALALDVLDNPALPLDVLDNPALLLDVPDNPALLLDVLDNPALLLDVPDNPALLLDVGTTWRFRSMSGHKEAAFPVRARRLRRLNAPGQAPPRHPHPPAYRRDAARQQTTVPGSVCRGSESA